MVGYLEQDCGYETPCWVWQGCILKNGYGAKKVAGKSLRAHKSFYEQENGAVPDGLELDHLCENKACVRPSHLQPVTHTENVQRGGCAKLGWEKIREIRDRFAAGGVLQRELAVEYGVNQPHISRIVREDSWNEQQEASHV
jgi:hypothetical protein